MPSHLAALLQLKQPLLGPQDLALLEVDAIYLDAVMDRLDQVERNAFPDLCDPSLLSRWEAAYGLVSTGTTAERRTRVVAAWRTLGGLSLPYFAALATDLGYSVSITRGSSGFRVGIDRVGIDTLGAANSLSLPSPPDWDLIYPGIIYTPDLWVFTVQVLSLGFNFNSDLLKSRIMALKPPFMMCRWVESSITSYLDEEDYA